MKILACLLSIGCVLHAGLASAQATDPMWRKTVERAQAAQLLVARETEVSASVSKNGQPASTAHFQSHLSGWAQGKAVYTTTELDVSPGAAKKNSQASSAMMNSIVEMEQSLLVPEAKVRRLDAQRLDGKSWTVFHVEDGGVGRKMAARIWVDAETACIHQVDTELHVALYIDAHVRTAYAPDAQGRCLPGKIDADIDIIVPFKGAKMKMTQSPTDWVVRPL